MTDQFKRIMTIIAFLFVGTSGISASANAESIRCINYYDHFGAERVVVFEGLTRNSDHIPDALFMIDRSNVRMEVFEKQGENYNLILETEALEQIDAKFLTEVFAHRSGSDLYALFFDRANATMNVRYSNVEKIVESSVDTSLCNLD